jgi:hypothetical protein
MKRWGHTPADAQTALIHFAEKLYGTTGVSSGSKNLDAIMVPTRPPWIRTWLAASGHGKSTQLRVIAKTEARRLVDADIGDRYAAILTYEEAIDSQELHMVSGNFTKMDVWYGRVPPQLVAEAAADRVLLPIYMIGKSMYKAELTGRKNVYHQPTIHDAIDVMMHLWTKDQIRPSVICIDYIQKVHINKRGLSLDAKTLRIAEGLSDISQMALEMECAIEMGSQARKEVLTRRDPIPTEIDNEWSNAIFQESTEMVALYRPWAHNEARKKAIKDGRGFDLLRDDGTKSNVPFTPDLVIARPLKNRPSAMPNTIAYRIRPDSLEVVDFPTQLIFP